MQVLKQKVSWPKNILTFYVDLTSVGSEIGIASINTDVRNTCDWGSASDTWSVDNL